MTTSASESLEFKDLLKKNQTLTKTLTKEYESNSTNVYFLMFI